MKIRVLIAIFLLVVPLLSGSGCIGSSTEPAQKAESEELTNNQDNSFNDKEETVPAGNFSENNNISELEKQSSFSRYYSKENPQFTASIPAYSLPLNASDLENYYLFTQKLPLTSESRDLLYKNGFVVLESEDYENIPGMGNSRINDTYRDLKVADLPIFITSDSLLHLYHIQFDETLKRVEAEEFYDDLWKLDKALLEASIEDYNRLVEDNASEEVTEAARRNVAYFAVALSLLEPKPE